MEELELAPKQVLNMLALPWELGLSEATSGFIS